MRQHEIDEAAPAPAPSISAASFCSSSSDCSAVSRISVAKGSHCQATMRMTENKRRIGEPVEGLQAEAPWQDQANSPLTGFMNMFFQTSAATVGMIEERRDHQDAHDPLARTSAGRAEAPSAMPPTTVMKSTPSTMASVLTDRLRRRRDRSGSNVVREARRSSSMPGHQQVVAQEREIDRHRQRDDHPGQKQKHGGRDHQARGGAGV